MIDINKIVTDRVFGTIDDLAEINGFRNIRGRCGIIREGRSVRPTGFVELQNGNRVDCIWQISELAANEVGHGCFSSRISVLFQIVGEVSRTPATCVIAYIEKGWIEHQDIIAFHMDR